MKNVIDLARKIVLYDTQDTTAFETNAEFVIQDTDTGVYTQFDGTSIVELTQAQIDDVNAQITEWKWHNIRILRDAKLAATDWTQTLDAPITAYNQTEFQTYRQALRDIPTTYTNPDDVVWPTEPAPVKK